MPVFKAACIYAASQDWLIVEDDELTLTTAGLAGGVTTDGDENRPISSP
jgi:hypothetical protein